jgi:hypothetical protein
MTEMDFQELCSDVSVVLGGCASVRYVDAFFSLRKNASLNAELYF